MREFLINLSLPFLFPFSFLSLLFLFFFLFPFPFPFFPQKSLPVEGDKHLFLIDNYQNNYFDPKIVKKTSGGGEGGEGGGALGSFCPDGGPLLRYPGKEKYKSAQEIIKNIYVYMGDKSVKGVEDSKVMGREGNISWLGF